MGASYTLGRWLLDITRICTHCLSDNPAALNAVARSVSHVMQINLRIESLLSHSAQIQTRLIRRAAMIAGAVRKLRLLEVEPSECDVNLLSEEAALLLALRYRDAE